MKQHIQTALLGLAISLILSCFAVNADTTKVTTSQVKYGHYYYTEDIHRQKYHGFLPSPAPEGLYYHTRMSTTANVDDTPEKENIVLIVVYPKQSAAPFGNWSQAFLLITDNNAAQPQKKAFFRLFDVGTHPLEVPAAKPIELHSPSFIFKQPMDVSFRLADVTDDGTLDVWVECQYGVALISFENNVFKEVFSKDTATREKLAETPEVEYHRYNAPLEPRGQLYHRFLGTPPPEGLYYHTRLKAIANIDDTPEKEDIVLITADTGVDGPQGEWVRAFLLITENEAGVLKKKALFKLFDAGTYHFDVSGKTIEVQSASFVFRKRSSGGPWGFHRVSLKLADLTGDGILDVWAEHAYGMAVISFQEGEFKEICSAYSSHKREDPIEYVDLDNDGIYEIKIPDRISIDGPTAAYLEWMSFYEWDGNTYRLNNKRFYANNDEFLNRLLDQYETWSRYSRNEVYYFYIGLVYYYQDNAPRAREFLQRVIEHGKKQDYRKAAEDLLKKLPSH